MGDCTNGDLRLMSGQPGHASVVEACVESNWRIVCGRDWDDNDAAVVCRQLSQSGPGKLVILRRSAHSPSLALQLQHQSSVLVYLSLK